MSRGATPLGARRFYVTTPIYYVNDVPHLGTAYSTIAVDALRRVHLLRGDAVRMLTGTDEHGLKLEREARDRGLAPGQFVRDMSDRFAATWPRLEVAPDDFIRTTEARHEQAAARLWTRIRERNPDDIYLGDYEGWYCVPCEELKTEKELEQPGNLCAIHKRPVERVKEKSYFFRLSRYQERLAALYAAHPGFIQPESRRNEVVSFVKGGLRDLSISRTSFTWGIPVPGDPKHVMYVWFDALSNYWTALQGSPETEAFWADDPRASRVHVIGKDILRFHAVYWPAFLLSAGLPLPTTIFAHGWLTYGGQKMSKSLRNAVEPLGIARELGASIGGGEVVGAEVLRYQLLRAISFGQDGDFDVAAMIERYNADLGKNLGNLLSRSLGLCAKLTGGKVPEASAPTPLEADLAASVQVHAAEAVAAWERFEPHRALERTWAIASDANQYVDRAAPWAEDKSGNTARVGTILSTLLSVLGLLSELVWPVLPSKSAEMRAQLGLEPLDVGVGHDILSRGLVTRPAGEPLGTATPLFRTLDADATRALLEKLAAHHVAEPQAPPSSPLAEAPPPETSGVAATAERAIGIDQLAAVDLRVGRVLHAARVPKKDKLLRLEIDLGEPAPRTIIAGLALSFTPELLVGRRVVVVANLAPREFGKGLVSHGMILATGPSEKLALATVDGEAEPGSRLK